MTDEADETDEIDDPAAPEQSTQSRGASTAGNPEAFRLRGSPPTVVRLSRKAMAILGVTGGVAIGGALIYALQPRPSEVPPRNVSSDNAHARSELVTNAPADYSKVPKLGPPLPGDLGRPILKAQANGRVVPVPTVDAQADPQAAAAEQARQRLVQEKESARVSRLFLGGTHQTSQKEAPAARFSVDASNPTTALPAAATSAGSAGTDEAKTSQAGKQAFLQVAADRSTQSAERLSPPASPYVLQAGSIIPAALITGIRSDLPGQVTAQVTENVYDSPTGRFLLIPQGSRLIGTYDSAVAAGQNRVLLAWDRLILPGGDSILLGRQPGADAAGMAGLEDGTNHHWSNLLKATAVSTLLGIGAELATDGGSQLVQALRYGTQDTVNQTGRNLVQREIDVPPTLTIRPGYPLRVIITRDLLLEPEGSKP